MYAYVSESPAPSPPRQQLNILMCTHTQSAEVHEQSEPLLHTASSLTPPSVFTASLSSLSPNERQKPAERGSVRGEKVMDREAETDDSLNSLLPS